ncbi:MAG: T9SS C-terminal target domain-containing protein [Bacteroidetes bacterium]|nr:MAG: T9SS C-terminal target domain-containing protein [Bacteroidota bacterium]
MRMKKILFLLSSIVSFFAVAQFPQPVLRMLFDALNGYNNINTTSGVSNGVFSGAGAQISDRCGVSNNSFNFFYAGGGNHVVVTNDPQLDILNQFTISFWLETYNGASRYVVSKPPYYLYAIGTGEIFQSITGIGSTTTGIVTPNGGWNHYVISKNSSNIFSYYLNGSLIGSNFLNTLTSSTNLLINGFSTDGLTSSSLHMNGTMNDFSFFNQYLSANEVLKWYKSSQVNQPLTFSVCPSGTNSILLPLNILFGANYSITGWFKNGTNLGLTTTSISLSSADIGSIISITGLSSCGSFESNSTTVVGGVFPSPTITGISGTSNTRCNNTSTTITCSAVGNSLSYKWLKNGSVIGAATDGGVYKNFNTATLSITGFPTSLVGTAQDFTCSVTGLCDGVLSAIYTISITGVPTFSGLSLGASECVGQPYTLSATGIYANTYRWRRGFSLTDGVSDGGIYTNATTQTLSISALPGNSTSTVLGYTLRAFGTCGTTTSSVISITVNGITSISGPATNTNYCLGNTKTISVTTNAGVGITYQWGMWDNTLSTYTPIFNNTFIAGVGTVNGVNASGLSISGMLSTISDVFIATATGVCGSYQSSVAGFTMSNPITATVPSGVTVCNNSTATFVATITGTPSAMIWLESTNLGASYSPLSGETSSIYSDTKTTGDDNKRYALSLTGFCGSFTTTGTILNVQNNTSITTVVSPLICQGTSGVVTVTAISVNPVYQWYKNSVSITSATDGGIYGTSFTTVGLNIANVPLSLNGANLYATVDGECGGVQISPTVTINVGTTVGISANPPLTFTTCLGLSTFVNALATGTGVNYQWQYFFSSWQNVTNAGGAFAGATSNQLTVSNFPNTLNGVSFRVSVTGTCGIGIASQVSTLQVNFGPNISVFGLKPKYCNYDDPDILEAFTDLSFPLSTVAGLFTAISGGAGLSITGMGFNKAAFRPFVYSNTTPVAIRYTSAPNALGCRNITTLTSTVYSVSGFGLQFVGLGGTFPSSQTSPENLVLTATGGFLGTSSFLGTFPGMNQSGVVGDLFYPNNVNPAPNIGNITKDVYITGQFTESVSGCSAMIVSTVSVFFPQNNYAFIPLITTNGYVDLPNKSSFCSTDYAIRLISFTGFQTPENLFSTRCPRSFALSIAGISNSVIGSSLVFDAITGTNRFDMNNFTFIPGNLSNGNYILNYYFDQTSFLSSCTNPRNSPQIYIQNNQQIEVFAKPSPPNVSSVSVCEDLININQVINVSGLANEYYTTTSTSSIISSLSGLNIVTLQQLGISTASGVGNYLYYVRQYVNGCPSDLSVITVTIRLKPTKPVITTSLPPTGGCINKNVNDNYFTLSASTTGANGYDWDINHNNALRNNNFNFVNSGFYTDYFRTNALEQVITVTAKSILNNCYSDPELKLISLNDLPPIPTVSNFDNGCLDFNNNFYQLPKLKFSVNHNEPVIFESQFQAPNITTLLGFSLTTFDGLSNHAISLNQVVVTTTGQIELLNYFAISSITGCKSIVPIKLAKNIFSTPNQPVSTPIDIYCNSSMYGVVTASGTAINWYGESNATTTGLATGTIFNVSSVMPMNRYLKNIHTDTLFYATQTTNGCESSTTGVRFRMYEPFVSMPISSTPLTVPYINLQFGTQPCEGNAGYAWIYNYSNNANFNHPLAGTKDLIIKDYLYFNKTFSGNNLFENGNNRIAYEIGSYSFGQNPKFDIQEIFKTPSNKICSSVTTLSGWQLVQKPRPTPPVLRDTAYCVPGLVGNILALSTVSGGFNPIFKWNEYNIGSLPKTYNTFSSNDVIPKATVTGSTLTGFHKSVFATSISVLNISATNDIAADTSNYEYYVTQVVDGCESFGSTIQKLKLYYTPDLPITTKKQEFCSGQTILPFGIVITPNTKNTQIDWFSTTSLNSMVATSVTSYLPPLSSTLGWTNTTTSYLDYIGYVTALQYKRNYPKLNFAGCRSSFASDTIRVKANPPTPTSTKLVKYCLQFGGLSNVLTANGIAGINSDFTWSDLASSSSVNSSQFNPNIGLSFPSTNKYGVSQNYDGCQSPELVVTVTVYNLPQATFSGINTTYCDGVLPSTLTGTNINVLVSKQFSIYDLTNSISNSPYLTTFGGASSHLAIFDVRNPATTVDKKYAITYTVSDTNNCVNDYTERINVFAKQVFSFNAFDDKNNSKTIYCSNDNKTQLRGTAPFGSFSSLPSSATIGNEFFPNATGVITNSSIVDTVKVIYSYADNNNCNGSTEKKFIVKPSPNASFKMSSHCVGISSLTGVSTIVGKNNDGINYFTWFINNDSISNQKNISYEFIASGLYNISYYVESDLGCHAEFSADSTIDAYPVVNFDWKNICSGDITQFTNKSFIPVGGGLLKDVTWKFASNPEQTVSSLTVNPSFNFGQTNAYPVTLKVSTQENCVTSLTSTVNILPVATISGFDSYTENFEANTGNWFANGLNSSWIWGSLTGTNTGVNTSSYWATNLNNGNYNQNERSYLYGPCLDIRGLNRPMIRMDLKYKTANANNDGMVLQFALSGDTVWQPVGNQGTGINWYKSRNIVNNPGEQVQFLTNILNNPQTAPTTGAYFRQMGWNGNSQDWITVRNTLDEAKNQSLAQNQKIRLRLAFATSGNVVSDGFAVDNVVVSSRSKKTLIENFANINSVASNTAQSQTLDNFFTTNKEDVVGLNYHTGFPTTDVFNAFNPSDPSTRVLYYGVETIPRAAVNGELVSGSSTNIGLNFLLDQTLLDPAFEIRAAFSNQNNLFAVTAQFVANPQLGIANTSSKEYIAHVAVVEKTISSIPNTTLTKSYKNVLKRMLPNPAGTSLIETWNAGTSKTIYQSWAYANGDLYNKDSLAAIIFIQDKETKKVLQAQLIGLGVPPTTMPTSFDDKNSIENKGVFEVYPNPSATVFNIIYSLSDVKNWELFDVTGRVLQSGLLENGSKTEIDAENLANGIYHLKIGNSIKKLVVNH